FSTTHSRHCSVPMPYTTLFRAQGEGRDGGESSTGENLCLERSCPRWCEPQRRFRFAQGPRASTPAYRVDFAQGPRASTPAYRVEDRKSTRLNSSHASISYAVLC